MTLFSPFSLAGITFPNRIAVSPMSQYWAKDGFANDWHIVHLGRFAMGGAGLVYLEATAVEERGRRTPGILAYGMMRTFLNSIVSPRFWKQRDRICEKLELR